ncbi:MAG: prolyl oligopeptidase family serine peptidase, partial [Alphaproteobacteria bacterium]|nr:prolyl oligopeptidase family serine peptidase [Alphaproteobacteria bacterium]
LPNAMRYSTLHRPFGKETILVSEDKEAPGFALIDLEADKAILVASPAPDAEFLGGAVKAGAVLFRHDHENGADLILADADGRETVLAKLNAHMANVEKTKWMTIKYKATSHVGEGELESCVLLPAGYEKGKRYPVIVEIYPNRGAICMRASSQQFDAIGRRPGPYSEHLLAARGYIVIQPNTSAELTQTKDGPLGGMASMTEQAVKALVDQGYGDPERVGLLGISQGGFSSLWLATQMPLFKATVSLNGWSDMYVHYFDATYVQNFYAHEFGFSASAGRYESTAGTNFPIGKKPYEDPLVYLRLSPLLNAPKVSAPIMLIHSDMDAFALQQYERMYVALNKLGKPAKLLRYWGEGHGPSSPGNIRHMWNEIFDWFDCFVKEETSACDSAYSDTVH